MTRIEFYEQFPGTILFTENRGYLNLGYNKYTEFQILNDETMEVVYSLFGSLSEEQVMSFEEYLESIKLLTNK